MAGYYDFTNDQEQAYKNIKNAVALDPDSEDIRATYDQFLLYNPQFSQ